MIPVPLMLAWGQIETSKVNHGRIIEEYPHSQAGAWEREKGSIRYYGKPEWGKLIRVDYHGSKRSSHGNLSGNIKGCRYKAKEVISMIDLPYSLIIEATEDPGFFGFYSPDLEGFSGVGHSVEDCIYKAKCGMREHVSLLKERRLPTPPQNPYPTVVIQNERRLNIAA